MARTINGEPVFLVLASLLAGPKHGYAMILDIEKHTGRKLGPGTLYGIIARIERAGFIKPSGHGDRGKTVYKITPAGKRAFEDALEGLSTYRRALNALAQR